MTANDLLKAHEVFWNSPHGMYDASLQNPPCAIWREVRILLHGGMVSALEEDSPTHSAGHLYLTPTDQTKQEAQDAVRALHRKCWGPQEKHRAVPLEEV